MGVNPLGRNFGFDEAIRTHSEVSLCVPKCESSEALSHCLLRNALGASTLFTKQFKYGIHLVLKLESQLSLDIDKAGVERTSLRYTTRRVLWRVLRERRCVENILPFRRVIPTT